MVKRGRFILIFLIFILLISSVYAVSVTYTYPGLTDINALVYKKLDNSKVGTYSSGTSNSITINYQDSPPSTNYYTYHYKQGYLSFSITSDTSGPMYNIIKQSSCKSQILSVNSPTTVNKNQQFVITINLADITSVFPDLVLPSFIPVELTEYYKADTKVKLYIDSNLIETKSIKISTSNNNLQFTPSISIAGAHNIKIETEVIDDQCASYINPQTSLATITVTEPAPTCSSDSQCKTGCSTGDPDCTCSQQSGDICTSTETCSGTSLQHSGTGTCCSVTCTSQQCPTCPSPSEWSACTNSKKTRTNYTCSSTTNYQCQLSTETQSCTQSPVGLCGADKECKKDKTVCTSGDPDCSCSQLNGYLCKEGELCITSLAHEDEGTCCSTPCIPPKIPCTQEGSKEICPPDSLGCFMIKECDGDYWSQCIKVDTSCIGPADCTDGTKSGLCSTTNLGKVCINGALQQHTVCITTSNQTCTELCDCLSWVTINEKQQFCTEWVDKGTCGTCSIPKDQKFNLDYKTPYEEYSLSTPSIITEGQAPKPEENKETVITQILDKLGIPFPKNLSVKVGFEYPIVLFVIAAVIAAFALYLFNHNPLKKIKIPQPKISQKTKSPVKPTDLLISVIESLKGDERRLADKLLEDEGITVEEMRKKLGLTKTKMDIALTKLERRQLLKERKDYNDGLYFNDWLK